MIIAYKVNFISYLIIKMMIKVKSITLINILTKENIIPEFIQSQCSANNLAQAILKYKNNPSLIEQQKQKNLHAIKLLSNNQNISPSQQSARIICNILLNHGSV